MKTKKAVAHKFKVTGTGKLLRRRPGKRHLLSGKRSKRKRQLGKPGLVFESVAHTYRRLMGVS
jgi:large subunit ribosomal protein L35